MTRSMLKLAATLAPGLAGRLAARRFLTPRPAAPRDEELEVLATATRGEMVCEGSLRLHAFVWDEPGPTVLLVHGWNGHVGQMTSFVGPLRRRGFRVVAHSAPAHGASGGSIAHVPLMARAVAAVARRFGPLHAIVGHSAGATAAARALQHGATGIGRMAVVAPATGPARWLDAFAAAAGLEEIRPSLVAAVEAEAGARLEEVELAAIAPRLRLPILAIHDAEDPLVPFAEVRRALRGVADGRLVRTEGLGHYRILRDPAVVREVAAFVAGPGPAAASPARSAPRHVGATA